MVPVHALLPDLAVWPPGRCKRHGELISPLLNRGRPSLELLVSAGIPHIGLVLHKALAESPAAGDQ